MKIGLLTQWYDPEPGSAAVPGVLARALTERGHDVQVVTGFPNYPAGRLYPGYRMRRALDELNGPVRVRRVALYPDHGRSPVLRFANYSSFALSASWSGTSLLRKMDAVWVYNSPATVGLPSMLASGWSGPPHLMHVMDLWPDSILLSGLTGGRTYRTMAKVLSRWCDLTYRSASAIACISRGIASQLASRGVPTEKLHHIPVWTDETVYRRKSLDVDLAADLDVTGAFTVLYAGNLGGAQGLRDLLEVCARVADLADLQVLIAGSGTESDSLRRRACDLCLRNVRFLGRWPAQDMGRLLSIADLALVCLSRDPLSSVTMPSKLPSLMASGKPILAWAEGEVASVLAESGAGVALPPGDIDGFEASLRGFHADRSQLARMGMDGERYYRENLSLDAGVTSVERLLEEIACG